MSLSDLTWYAFRTDSGLEQRALKILLQLEYTPFLPIEYRHRRRSRYAKQSRNVAYAKYPGYIFIGFRGPPPWRQLWSIDRFEPVVSLAKPPIWLLDEGGNVICRDRGGERFIPYSDRVLKGVVGFEGRPTPAVPEQIQRAIAESCAYVPDRQSSRTGFGVGDNVEIVDGAWQGHVTKVEGIYGDKAKVFLQLFGSSREVEIAIDALEAA